MGSIKKAYVTFDVDFADYLNNENIDELDLIFEKIKTVFLSNPEVRTTWFIRIDSQIEKMYGTGDFLYNKHVKQVDWLKQNGHSVGWHHHSYKLEGKNWIQDTDEAVILKDLKKYGVLAKERGLSICRMGWGFHTNKTMKLVSDMGFTIDSSAVPRPNYKWDLSVKNWEDTTLNWYHPSCQDYRVAGEPSLAILETPISTIQIPVDTDTEENVIRYINPAYYSRYFVEALTSLQNKSDKIILITHPYELIANQRKHSLLAFSINVFESNLDYLKKAGYEFDVLK